MRLLVVHLSDFHFSRKNALGEPQVKAICSAALSLVPIPDAVCIVISGDIAATGSEEDYEIASQFVKLLQSDFENIVQPEQMKVVTVPGNHDFDDSILREAGDILANQVLQNELGPTDAQSTYDLLLSGQKQYWNFDEQWSASPALTLEDKLFRKVVVRFADEEFSFELFNTAILSRKHETQGQLWFPVAAARAALSRKARVTGSSFCIFHHPYVWLESNNSTRFRQLIESFADFALNGHQHTPESYFVTSLSSTQTWYSAGAALIGKNTDDSGFAVIAIDTETRTRRLARFEWNGSLYLNKTDTGEYALPSSSARRGIALTEEFASYLDDPESLIVHTQKKNVLLQDIFEPVRLRGGESKSHKTSRVVTSPQIREIFRENEAVFIFGDSLSGKTCLAKDIFRQLFNRDGSCIPVLLSGRELASSKTHDIERWCSRAVRAQFKGISAPEYQVMPRDQKVAIVDDWHSLGLNEKSKQLVMKELCARHLHTILLCDSWYQAQELASVLDSTDPLLPKNHYVILPLRASQRGNMVRRWMLLGRADDVNDSDFIFQCDGAEKYLDELHRSGLMPPYPLYILTALQTLQAIQQSEPDLGAQGVLFDLLIGNKLRSMSADAPELDINRQFIAFVAHDIFMREEKGISEDRADQLQKDFLERFAVSVKLEPLLKTLCEHKVLSRSDGVISFRHRYMYYYFIAEHMVSSLAKGASRDSTMKQLKDMTAFVAYEEYAQILMFVIYRTRNEDLIDELIANSKKVFHGTDPSDLGEDVAFVNRLDVSQKTIDLGLRTVEENREARREELPAETGADAREEDPTQSDLARKVVYSENLDWGAKIQFAFKTTQTLGRVLRNFPGTLDAAQKKELAENAYGASLRMLRNILSEAEREKEDIRAILTKTTDESETLTATEKLQLADARLIAIITLCGYAIVRFLTAAVGSAKLELTLNELRDEMPDVPSIQLIDLAIRLDNFRNIPVERLMALEKSLKGNFVAHQILRMIVWHRLTYLPLDDRKLRESLCAKFGIKASSTPLLIANTYSRAS
jgi:hypothetical protein